MARAIIFDLTQTLQLFDFQRMRAEFKKILKKIPSAKKVPIKKFMRAYQRAYDLYQIGKIRNDAEFCKKIFEQLKICLDKKQTTFFTRAHRNCRKNFILLAPRLAETLQALKKAGFRLGILSNCVENWLPKDWKMLRFNPKKYFAVQVSSQRTGIKKPNARAYKIILKKMKLRASQAVMVGDNYEQDVLAPRAIGMKTILLNKQKKRGKADFVVRELFEIVKLKELLQEK